MSRLIITLVCVAILMVLAYTDGYNRGKKDGVEQETARRSGETPVFDQLADELGVTFKSKNLQRDDARDLSNLDRLDGLK